MSTFLSKFKFKPELSGFLGVEREQIICRQSDGKVTPAAPELFASLGGDPRFGYELSACQIETKIGPTLIADLPDGLRAARDCLENAADNLELRLSDDPVAPADMPLDVFPDPTGRYQRLSQTLPPEVLLAACRVIGVHVHVGVASFEAALAAYNRAVEAVDELVRMGDQSNGERLKHYVTMAPNWRPPAYASLEDFERTAHEQKFAEDPRSCYHLVRISPHGTVEFRMFDGTGDLNAIELWARTVWTIVTGTQ